MKKLLATALVALMATAGAAFAADPVNSDRNGLYAGVNASKLASNRDHLNLGGVVGYQMNPYLRAEADYNHQWGNGRTGQTLFGNVIGQYRLPNTTVTPYVLAGVGMGFDSLGQVKSGDVTGLYQVGAGARVAISQNIELDGRYTNIRPFSTASANIKSDNMFTAGMNFRF